MPWGLAFGAAYAIRGGLMEDVKKPWKSAAFSQYPRGKAMGYSMRTDRYRYTEWRQSDGKIVAQEVYDHQEDPDENVNLAVDQANAGLVARLAAQCQEGWRAARPVFGQRRPEGIGGQRPASCTWTCRWRCYWSTRSTGRENNDESTGSIAGRTDGCLACAHGWMQGP